MTWCAVAAGCALTGGCIEVDPNWVFTRDGGPKRYPDLVREDDPLAYWRLGEPDGAVAKDSGAAGLDGVASPDGGSLEWGRPGALDDDADTAVRLADGASVVRMEAGGLAFPGRAPYSLEAWVEMDPSELGSILVLSSADVFGPDGHQTELANDGYTHTRIAADEERHVSFGEADLTGGFHHVVVTFDGAGAQLFLDGVPGSATAEPLDVAIVAPGGPFLIAATESPTSAVLDELAVYDHVLSTDRIAAHYHCGVKAADCL